MTAPTRTSARWHIHAHTPPPRRTIFSAHLAQKTCGQLSHWMFCFRRLPQRWQLARWPVPSVPWTRFAHVPSSSGGRLMAGARGMDAAFPWKEAAPPPIGPRTRARTSGRPPRTSASLRGVGRRGVRRRVCVAEEGASESSPPAPALPGADPPRAAGCGGDGDGDGPRAGGARGGGGTAGDEEDATSPTPRAAQGLGGMQYCE